MKFFLPALLLILLTSCTKEPLSVPGAVTQNLAAITAVAYKDNSISIIDFKAQQGSGAIQVKFTTLYEKNIVKLEILRGLTENNLCSIYKQDVNSDSNAAIQYYTSDSSNNNEPAIYYMIKYTLANGDWGYTPVFKLCL